MIWVSIFKADWPINQYLMYMAGCGFTDREKRIVSMVRTGKSQCAISQEINYCDSTVDKDVRKIKNKIIRFEAYGLPPS